MKHTIKDAIFPVRNFLKQHGEPIDSAIAKKGQVIGILNSATSCDLTLVVLAGSISPNGLPIDAMHTGYISRKTGEMASYGTEIGPMDMDLTGHKSPKFYLITDQDLISRTGLTAPAKKGAGQLVCTKLSGISVRAIMDGMEPRYIRTD